MSDEKKDSRGGARPGAGRKGKNRTRMVVLIDDVLLPLLPGHGKRSDFINNAIRAALGAQESK